MSTRAVSTPEHRALSAIASVLSRGALDADLVWIRDIPGLQGVADQSLDARLAEHERVLGRGVYAFQSVFTRDDALRSPGPTTWFDRHGLRSDEPDALGDQLALFAQTGDAAFARTLTWTIPALVAVERQGGALYPALARMARALLAEHLQEALVELPAFADPLDDDKTGLRRLAEHLLVPVKSGWFLSRGDLLRLAGQAECPCGFGSRVQMLEAYFRTAVEHERLATAVDVLQSELSIWSSETAIVPAWAERASATHAMLGRLRHAQPLKEPPTPG